MLKLYFYTQSIRTPIYFDLSWGSNLSDFLERIKIETCQSYDVLYVKI